MDVFDQNEDGSTRFLIFALFDIRFLPFLKTLKSQKCHFLSVSEAQLTLLKIANVVVVLSDFF